MTPVPMLDCVVIGAGPSGLTAAMYLRRFHRPIALLDAGESRARWIPESHNCPGFPGGVSGNDLLAKLREQANDYGVVVTQARATGLSRSGAGFSIQADDGREYSARCVILATGVVDVLPDTAWAMQAVESGAIRLCAVCDGYEASDGRLAVYGPMASVLTHAAFLRTFSQTVTVAPSDGAAPDEEGSASVAELDLALLAGPCVLAYEGDACAIVDARGREHRFDSVYPVLGAHSQSELATAIGAAADENGELIVGSDQMTSIEGLYAIGDVVSALNQISVGVGHAAIAATAAHNFLRLNPR